MVGSDEGILWDSPADFHIIGALAGENFQEVDIPYIYRGSRKTMWVEIQKYGKTPQIIHLLIGFSMKFSPSILGVFHPIFGNIHVFNGFFFHTDGSIVSVVGFTINLKQI